MCSSINCRVKRAETPEREGERDRERERDRREKERERQEGEREKKREHCLVVDGGKHFKKLYSDVALRLLHLFVHIKRKFSYVVCIVIT